MLVTGSLQCGGSERQMADMANYWAAEGLEVTLATWSGPQVGDFYRLDRRVRRLHLDVESSGRIWGNFGRILKLRRLVAEIRPDAVLSFLTRSNVPTILAGVGRQTRIVVSERVQPAFETGLQLGWRVLRRLVYKRADALVSQTRVTADWMQKHWHRRAFVIPNALRTLPPPPDQREPLILATGRLVSQKGFDLLLESFARIAHEFPDWRIAIAGDGPERRRLDQLQQDRGLAGRVEFLGHVPHIESWMARAGLVVQPSRFEGFPNAVLESMGMGAPVISTDCPAGPAELIKDGVNGRLVPIENVDALARVMRELMREPEQRARLGHAATKVRERYRQESIMEQWKSVLAPR